MKPEFSWVVRCSYNRNGLRVEDSLHGKKIFSHTLYSYSNLYAGLFLLLILLYLHIWAKTRTAYSGKS
jgi:hypothetical protein